MFNRLADAKKDLVESVMGQLEEVFKKYKLGELDYNEVASKIKRAGSWFFLNE